MRTNLLALLGAVLVALPLGAQRLGPEVPRPRLAASADTNDALAYLEHGMSIITDKAEDGPLFITDTPEALGALAGAGSIAATDVKALVLSHVFGASGAAG